jgi:hypothetical protein
VLRRWTFFLEWLLIGLLVLLLPFTSFPQVARLTGSSMVAPLAILPLLALLVFWFAPYILRSGGFSLQTLPLFAFLVAALISAAAAFFIHFPPFKSETLLSSEMEGLATLAVGVCFYLVVAAWGKSAGRLRFLLRCVNWSGFIILVWSFVQYFVWQRMDTYPQWMWDLQFYTSTSQLLYGSRVTGFAYEPSWLAHQMNMLYLPVWLAAAVTGFTAHRFRLWKIHFEHLLLVAGIGVLVLSVSRIGLLTFVLMVAYLIFLMNMRFIRWAQSRLEVRFLARIPDGSPGAGNRVRLFRRGFIITGVLVLILLYAGLFYGAAYGMSRYDPRMSRLFDFSTIHEISLMQYANQLVFAERIVFWQAGWEVFNDYPIIGVGPGNAGYFFPEKLSAFSWGLFEVRALIYQWETLPNIKSLWVRLLAETGIVGFSLFAGWCYVLWKSARVLFSRGGSLLRTVGLAGSFAIIGLAVEGFSVDTFALPYYWFSFGLLTAACGLPAAEAHKISAEIG